MHRREELFCKLTNLNNRSQAISMPVCAATFGRLFKFASISLRWDCNFDIKLTGNTLFLVRIEESAKKLIDVVYGYGHTFPTASTYLGNDVHDASPMSAEGFQQH